MLSDPQAPVIKTIQQEKENMNQGIEINLARTNSQIWRNPLQTGEGPSQVQVWSSRTILKSSWGPVQETITD